MKFEHKPFSLSADSFIPSGKHQGGPQEQMHRPNSYVRPAIVIRGLPGVGKTTLANLIADVIRRSVTSLPFHINADVVRQSLNSDLNFGTGHRIENARRIGALAYIAQQNGYHPIVDFVMPTLETYEAFKQGLKSDAFRVYSLNGDPDFVSRYSDTQKLFEPCHEWPLGYDPATKSGRVFNIPHFEPKDLELYAHSIFIDSRS